MDNQEWTKGPWKIEGQDIISRAVGVINGFICQWSGNKADAHLIAASPDMFKELEDIAELIKWMQTEESVVDYLEYECGRNIDAYLLSIEVILAKARGESNE